MQPIEAYRVFTLFVQYILQCNLSPLYTALWGLWRLWAEIRTQDH